MPAAMTNQNKKIVVKEGSYGNLYVQRQQPVPVSATATSEFRISQQESPIPQQIRLVSPVVPIQGQQGHRGLPLTLSASQVGLAPPLSFTQPQISRVMRRGSHLPRLVSSQGPQIAVRLASLQEPGLRVSSSQQVIPSQVAHLQGSSSQQMMPPHVAHAQVTPPSENPQEQAHFQYPDMTSRPPMKVQVVSSQQAPRMYQLPLELYAIQDPSNLSHNNGTIKVYAMKKEAGK